MIKIATELFSMMTHELVSYQQEKFQPEVTPINDYFSPLVFYLMNCEHTNNIMNYAKTLN
jgi:hypothetical protein